MHHIFPLLLALCACSSASILKRRTDHCVATNLETRRDCELKYLQPICRPILPNGKADLSAPCHEADILYEKCWQGTNKVHFDKAYGAYILSSYPNPQSHNNTQRVCACESQFWDAQRGCSACFMEHGGGLEFSYPKDYIDEMSSAYCAATATPTLDLLDFQQSWLHTTDMSAVVSSATAQMKTSEFSDPLGRKTDVSLYWTSAVTGIAALDIGTLTAGATPATTNIVDGQIVATAGSVTAASPPSSSTSKGIGAPMKSGQAVAAGAMGMVVIAGLL